MPQKSYQFTSESVTEGHPDKVCDQISDAVLDFVMREDPTGRVAIETLVTTGTCLVAGEMTTSCYVPVDEVARRVIEEIGYTRAKYGFDAETTGVLTAIHAQSTNIAQGVDVGGAGDQGMMFGFACDDTPEFMPMPIHLAHRLAERLAHVRKTGELDYLRPDGKTQVTVRYEDDRPVEVTKVLIAAQHRRGMDQDEIRSDLIQYVVDPIIPRSMCSGDMQCLVNRTGIFEIGGPQADTGVTGRKIIVDTYGGYARHGGGAFSGKDPTKVDRSGAYFARYVAKNIVAAGLARKCEIEIAYAIGDPEPFSIAVFCFGTEVIPEDRIAQIVADNFDFSPKAMIDHLRLRRPIFRKTAAYGHFGREDDDFTWERLDAIDMLRSEAGL